MFTGLVEKQGQVKANLAIAGGRRLVIDAAAFPALKTGESIAVNGVCLTLLAKDILTAIDCSARRDDIERAELTRLSMGTRDESQQRRKCNGEELAFDLSQETLKCTTLGSLCEGDFVNLERAMDVSDRFGGHYVSGHVDTTAVLTAATHHEDYLEITVSMFALSSAALYLIPKGSITLDGVSLTINSVNETTITLMLIPHTLALTTFSELKVGHQFNVEFDYLARVVAHQLTIAGRLSVGECS